MTSDLLMTHLIILLRWQVEGVQVWMGHFYPSRSKLVLDEVVRLRVVCVVAQRKDNCASWRGGLGWCLMTPEKLYCCYYEAWGEHSKLQWLFQCQSHNPSHICCRKNGNPRTGKDQVTEAELMTLVMFDVGLSRAIRLTTFYSEDTT